MDITVVEISVPPAPVGSGYGPNVSSENLVLSAGRLRERGRGLSPTGWSAVFGLTYYYMGNTCTSSNFVARKCRLSEDSGPTDGRVHRLPPRRSRGRRRTRSILPVVGSLRAVSLLVQCRRFANGICPDSVSNSLMIFFSNVLGSDRGVGFQHRTSSSESSSCQMYRPPR